MTRSSRPCARRRYGEKLHEMLGAEAACDYLRFVLETAAAGLHDGQSKMLIGDQIRAELFNHFRSAEQRLLDEGGRHAAIVVKAAPREATCVQKMQSSRSSSKARPTNW